ncbi:hypothetical protein M406DRAFT_334427 [Cryphonectria parasitica EP155]|uniref:Up-regulated during septation protein 1 domain-containing protein n=1 Tax=Cryphonectria parasitica (strain ATCC 38755 / EP155) TaxID=660469 RepID=A0A9P4XTV8_CRYP1|nr:uncharacterized protein M406DRAFT_334427 [Cryphonectria parasitica EP155]KAF3760808.1 hypothetical protein M406DRAFT_334427 [Cryphonectria parasitica EP155]
MAHIASCIQPVPESDRLSISSYIIEQQASKPWVWRMAQSDSRKYQLFPREKQVAASPVQSLDPEQAFALAMGQGTDGSESKFGTGNLRLRIREHNLPLRRRKVSVPELGPMTTVHESSMDSRTWYSTTTPTTLPTPVSATHDPRRSPKPSKPITTNTLSETAKEQATDTINSDAVPLSAVEPRSASAANHRRNMSDSASVTGSIMDRGRPKKKSENGPRGGSSKKSKSAERLAFERLPKGWKVPDAMQMLDASETTALNRQALQQAERFEMLRKSDVDSLSRELRSLDERCEYLRRTYHSLRAGRRNLHSRICQYLRSPRTVKFSQESLLKQEEALAELDASIDDWVSKLEQAENRRTRVRQKLLEHVAAAVTIPIHGALAGAGRSPFTLDMKSPTAPADPSTPPRSPTKVAFTPRAGASSPSPCRVVAQVPSTIVEQPLVEEEAASAPTVGLGIDQAADEPATAGIRRSEVESIRIYAGDEVAALLADVEQQITSMSKATEANAALREKDAAAAAAARQNELASLTTQERKQLHRAQSHEAFRGGKPFTFSGNSTVAGPASAKELPTSVSPRTVPTTVTETKQEDPSHFILPSAVFDPKTATVH